MSLPVEKALEYIAKAMAEANRTNTPIACVVTDVGGNIIAAARMDNVGPLNFEAARKKAYAAANFKAGTHQMAGMIARDELIKAALTADTSINFLPGGLPVLHDGRPAGGLGVAGGFYVRDKEIAEEALS
jgi:glc operon protein GlcG